MVKGALFGKFLQFSLEFGNVQLVWEVDQLFSGNLSKTSRFITSSLHFKTKLCCYIRKVCMASCSALKVAFHLCNGEVNDSLQLCITTFLSQDSLNHWFFNNHSSKLTQAKTQSKTKLLWRPTSTATESTPCQTKG